MSEFEVGDVVVVTGPLSIDGEVGCVHLVPGEVGDVVEVDHGDPEEPLHLVRVSGRESERRQWIDASSLTPFSEIAEDPNTKWGDPSDPDYARYQGVHDYVYEEGEE